MDMSSMSMNHATMSHSMDHSTMSHTMAMDHSTMSHTMAMDMPSQTTGAMDHSGHNMSGMGSMGSMGGMDHSMGGGGCKVSMMLNLNTIDACFLSEGWHITSRGMFAGSCIGVFFFAMLLEFLRRSVKEYDRFLLKQHAAKFQGSSSGEGGSFSSKDAGARAACAIPPFRPNAWQQAIRAFLHLLQFVNAYFLMLIAMYYNGYMLLCIFLGVLFGAYVFQWESMSVGGKTTASDEPTVCCG